MAGGKTILGIDIGSTKITAVVGEHDPARGLIWRAINVKPTEAVDRGVIRDLNQATQDIDSAYSGAMYSSLMRPAMACSRRLRCCSRETVLLMTVAGRPR